MPASTAIIQINGCPSPRYCGRILTCKTPITIAANPRIDPTDRSMWRVTITRTMPVAIIPIDDVCTDRFHKLRGVRNAAKPFL